MHSWFLLRHDGLIGSDRHLLRWNLFSCLGVRLLLMSCWYVYLSGLSINLHELFCWHFCCDNWTECMQRMYSWFLLRHDGLIGSDRNLLCWDVFSCISFRLLLMSCWHLHLSGISVKLLELCLRHFRRYGWLECLYCLHSWFLLRHGGLIGGDRHMHRRKIFGWLHQRPFAPHVLLERIPHRHLSQAARAVP